MRLIKSLININFIENTFSLVALKLIDLALVVFLIPYLILVVGIENYGRYAFAMASVLFFVNIANYGFELTTVRSIAKHQGNSVKINALVNEVFTVKLYLTIGLFVVLFGSILLIPTFSNDAYLYFLASSLLMADLFSMRWFFMGIERMKFWAFINLLATLCYVILVVLFITRPEHYSRIALLEGVGFFTINLISFLWVLNHFKLKLALIPSAKVAKYLWKHWSSFSNLFIPSMTSNAAVFLVGLFGVPTHVSIMQLAIKISNGFCAINTIITKVFYAMVNRKIQFFRQSVLVTITIGIVLSILMFISSEALIFYWLKITTDDTEQLLIISKLLSPTPLLMALISAYGVNGLLVFGKDVLFGKLTLITAFIGFIIGLFFIPSYTIVGGAIFLLTTRGLYAVGSLLLFRKKLVLKLKSKTP